jgi:hypothetical protein
MPVRVGSSEGLGIAAPCRTCDSLARLVDKPVGLAPREKLMCKRSLVGGDVLGAEGDDSFGSPTVAVLSGL